MSSRVCMCGPPLEVHTEGYYATMPKSNVSMKIHFHKDRTCSSEEEWGTRSPQKGEQSAWESGSAKVPGESVRRSGTWQVDPVSKHIKIKLDKANPKQSKQPELLVQEDGEQTAHGVSTAETDVDALGNDSESWASAVPELFLDATITTHEPEMSGDDFGGNITLEMPGKSKSPSSSSSHVQYMIVKVDNKGYLRDSSHGGKVEKVALFWEQKSYSYCVVQ